MATEVPEAKVDLVAKEIELTKLLASNDPKTRNDGIKQIKQLLLKNSEDTSDAFQLNDYLIIWRGLFYFMWTSDKPVPQESVTEKLSYLIHSCTSYQGKIFFLDAFFLTIKDDWMSIKQHRTDKCMMWVRHCLRQLVFTFVNCDWNLEYINKFSEVLYRALKSFTLSLRTHLQVIFLEELAKVSRGKVPSEALVIILDSFLHYISELDDIMLIKEVTQNVFRNLLSPSSELETLAAKFQDLQIMTDPGKSNNDLELIEGDIPNDDFNDINDYSSDPQAGNVSVEIPRIKFNPKDVAKVLNKYLNEVDCTRQCLLEIARLIQFYNRLGDCILHNKPKDLKLNSQVLKHKKKKYLSKMVKEGVKKLKMVDSRIKKSGLEVYDHKSLKKLNKMDEIVRIVRHGKNVRSMWKVSNVDNGNTFNNNFNINNSWRVTNENIINGTNTVCVNDDKPKILVPPGFNVEVSESPKKKQIKDQNKILLTPNIKSLTVDSFLKENNSNKHKSRSQISKINDRSKKKYIKKQDSRIIQIGTPNALYASHKNSLSISADHEVAVSKKVKNSIESPKSVQSVNASTFNKKIFSLDNKIEEKNLIDDDPPLRAPTGFNVKVSESPTKVQNNGSLTQNIKSLTVDSSLKEINSNKRKSKSQITKVNKIHPLKKNFNFNGLWTISEETKTDGTNTVCNNDDVLPLMVPVGFNVEVLETPEKTLTKLQKNVSLTPNFKTLTVDSSIKELNKMGEMVVGHRRIVRSMWKVSNVDNGNTFNNNFNLNNSWRVTNENIINGTNTMCVSDDKPPILVPPGFNVEVLESPKKKQIKDQNKILLTPNIKSLTVDSFLKENNSNKHKCRSQISKMNDRSKKKYIKKQNSRIIQIGTPNALKHKKKSSLTADHGGSNTANEHNEKSIQKSISPFDKICSPNIVNTSYNNCWSLSADNDGSASNKVKKSNPSSKVLKDILLTSIITPDKSSNSSKSPTFEQRVLRRRTIFPKNTPDEQNEGTPKRKVKKTSSTKVLKERRKTIAGSKPDKVVKCISLTSVISTDKSSNSSKCPAFEQRVLRRRTVIFPKNKPDGQNEGTPKRKVKNTSSTKVLKERRKTIAGSKPDKVVKGISLTSVITPDKSSKSLNNPTIERRVLRRRATIIPINKPEEQNKGTPKIKIKKTSSTKVLKERRKTIAGSKPDKVVKDISLTSVISPDKSYNSSKSPAFEQRVLRRRTVIFPKNKPDGQNEGTPKRKVKNTSSTKVLKERRKTIAGSKPDKVVKGISLTSVITPDKSSKSLNNPTIERRVLRRRATIIPINKPEEQNKGTPKRKGKKTSATRALHERKKTIAGSKTEGILTEGIPNRNVEETSSTRVLRKYRKTMAGEEINMLKPEEISNKALEKVRSKAFEDGSGSLRRSPRLSIKSDSVKKSFIYQCSLGKP